MDTNELATLIRETDTDLVEMLHAYAVAALWSTGGPEDDCENLDEKYDLEDLHPSCWVAFVRDCRAFLAKHRENIGDNYGQAGHDLWLTRNGHGCGFGDRPEIYGEESSEAMEADCYFMGGTFQQVDIYPGDDGKIYQSGAEPPSHRYARLCKRGGAYRHWPEGEGRFS